MADKDSSGEEKESDGEPEIVPSLENSVIPPPSTPQPKRLDPLVQSLTRMDAVDDPNAKTVQVPIFGELVLDKSLYIFVPAVAFAVIGFVTSIYVALTATDEWVIPSQSEQTPKVINDSGCRGLCSQQEQDLEGLREYMQRFAK
eukprot:scaffold2974_cov181-Amphora_coffeaeformis.AAC.12